MRSSRYSLRLSFATIVVCLLVNAWTGMATDRLSKKLVKQLAQIKDFPLSQEEISKAQSAGEVDSENFSIVIGRHPMKISAPKEEGSTPIRICLSIYAKKKGRKTLYYREGDATLYFINDKNEIVKEVKESLRQFCPS